MAGCAFLLGGTKGEGGHDRRESRGDDEGGDYFTGNGQAKDGLLQKRTDADAFGRRTDGRAPVAVTGRERACAPAVFVSPVTGCTIYYDGSAGSSR